VKFGGKEVFVKVPVAPIRKILRENANLSILRLNKVLR
jgi:hypothetical protein